MNSVPVKELTSRQRDKSGLSSELGVKNKFKVIIVGNSFVGKSNLMLNFVQNKTDGEAGGPTLNADFKFHTIKVENKDIMLCIYDTAGQEK